MSDSQMEKDVKKIRKDLDTLMTKIDLIIEKSKKKDSIGEAIKDSYQLFVAAIMGAFSGVLIDTYIKYPSIWLAGLVLISLSAFSLFFTLIIRYTFRNPKRQKKEK